MHYPSNIDIYVDTLNELVVIIGLQPIIENIPHISPGPTLKHVNSTKKPKLVFHPIVMIQKVPSIN
jgi:hypothetical protein